MAPFEFEKSIKDKLTNREIQPSDTAWEKISSRLGKEKAPRGNSRYRIYLAAAVIVLLFGLRLAFPPQEPGNENFPLVVTPETPDEQKVASESPAQPKVEEQVERPAEPAASELAANPEPDSKRRGSTVEQEATPGGAEDFLAQADSLDNTELERSISIQLDTVMARFAALEAGSGSVTDAQIDSLLQEAQQQITAGNNKVAADSVDAMALLGEAEFELDKTFRETLFDKLKTGFDQVRVAMANKNN
jgi:acyl carrier protein